LLNPAVGLSVGFNDMWNFRLAGRAADPLWGYFWIAWLIGPFLGALLAYPFFHVYDMT